MSIKVAYSTKTSPEELVVDIQKQFKNINTRMLIFFASSIHDQQALSQKMQKGFPSAITFGCSTAGEIISGKMLKNSVVAMAFDENSISDVKVEVIEDIKAEGNVKKAFEAFEKYYGEAASKMDYQKYVGIVLMDGLSLSEEKLMERIGDLTNVIFIGGSAGDDLKFAKTSVYVNGQAFSNASVLALLKPQNGFDFIKTQSFDVLDQRLIATKVITESREVLEFNQKPAVEAYADALGCSVHEASGHFMSNPVGLLAEDEVYVRSPQQFKDNSMVFYCNILEGMEVLLLKSTDIVKDTRTAIENKLKELGQISGIINFNCILRTLELEQKGQTEAYSNIFSKIPTIGFSTYGEAYYGHINQTSTMLVFK